MTKGYVDREWSQLCQDMESRASKTRQTAEDPSAVDRQVEEFTANAPSSYIELLQRVRDAARLSREWRSSAPDNADVAGKQAAESPSNHAGEEHPSNRERPGDVDEALRETFPASDPPAWNASRS